MKIELESLIERLWQVDRQLRTVIRGSTDVYRFIPPMDAINDKDEKFPVLEVVRANGKWFFDTDQIQPSSSTITFNNLYPRWIIFNGKTWEVFATDNIQEVQHFVTLEYFTIYDRHMHCCLDTKCHALPIATIK